MNQPLSLFLLASAAATQNCQSEREVRALEVPRCILPSLVDSFERIKKGREVVSNVIRKHFVYFDVGAREYTGPRGTECIGCVMTHRHRRFKCAPLKLQYLIEKKMIWVALVLSNSRTEAVTFKEDAEYFEHIACVAVHRWIKTQTRVETRRRRRDLDPWRYYDPFEKIIKTDETYFRCSNRRAK